MLIPSFIYRLRNFCILLSSYEITFLDIVLAQLLPILFVQTISVVLYILTTANSVIIFVS